MRCPTFQIIHNHLNLSTSSPQFGDLSVEIDKRVKDSVAEFCGTDTYTPGDLSKEVAKRTKSGVLNYTGKDSYQVRNFLPIVSVTTSHFVSLTCYLFSLETSQRQPLRTTLEKMTMSLETLRKS